LAYDLSREYLAASAFRFLEDTTDAEIKSAFDRIMAGNSIALRPSKRPWRSTLRNKRDLAGSG